MVEHSKYLTRALLLMMLVVPSFLFLRETKRKEKLIALLKQPWKIGFLFYCSFLFISTLLARNLTNPVMSIFDSFGFTDAKGKLNTELLENMMLFVPYTILFLQAFKFKTETAWKEALKLSFYSSCFIELSQLIFWLGEFQLSDIVHNTLGGMIGTAIWYGVQWIWRKVTA